MRRSSSTRLLVLLGGMLTVVAVLAGYARGALLDEAGFAGRAVQAVQAESVRQELATSFSDAVIDAEPRLLAARPQLTSAAESVLLRRDARPVIRRAAREAHRGLFSREQSSMLVNLAGLLRLVRSDRAGPDANLDLSQLSVPSGSLVIAIGDRALGTRITQAGAWLSAAALLAPLLAMLAWAAALARSVDRARTLRAIGVALLLSGAVVLGIKAAAGAVLIGALEPGAAAEIGRALRDAFFGDLTRWGLFTSGVGALLAMAAAAMRSTTTKGTTP